MLSVDSGYMTCKIYFGVGSLDCRLFIVTVIPRFTVVWQFGEYGNFKEVTAVWYEVGYKFVFLAAAVSILYYTNTVLVAQY